MCIVLTLFYFALTALWQPDVLCPNLARYASYADSVCPAVVLNPEKGKKYGNVYEYSRVPNRRHGSKKFNTAQKEH